MNTESAVISILMYSLGLYSALVFNDVFASVLFWFLGVAISIMGLFNGGKK